LLQYVDEIRKIYKILDDIFQKASSNESLKAESIDQLYSYIQTLNTNLFTNIVAGQEIIISNESYKSQLNRLSILNVPKLSLEYDSPEENKKFLNAKYFKKTKIRLSQNRNLQENKKEECEYSLAAICIPPKNITSIMYSKNTKEAAFQAQLNSQGNPLPVNETQFSNSLDFGLSADQKDGKLRLLDTSELNIRFEVRLKMPVNKNKSVIIQDSTCVQYSAGKADTSCESWYDLDTNEVICSCIKQGITINVVDQTLSKFSKLRQFPSLSVDICNYFFILNYERNYFIFS